MDSLLPADLFQAKAFYLILTVIEDEETGARRPIVSSSKVYTKPTSRQRMAPFIYYY